MDMFLVPIAYTHMCVYRRLLRPSGNMFDTGQQARKYCHIRGTDKSEFCDVCLECELMDVEKPTPKDNEVLVRVHAAPVAMGDCELRGLKVPFEWKLLLRIGFGIRAPRRKILGQELAGEIESTGRDVTRFKKGDQVFALTGLHLGAY